MILEGYADPSKRVNIGRPPAASPPVRFFDLAFRVSSNEAQVDLSSLMRIRWAEGTIMSCTSIPKGVENSGFSYMPVICKLPGVSEVALNSDSVLRIRKSPDAQWADILRASQPLISQALHPDPSQIRWSIISR